MQKVSAVLSVKFQSAHDPQTLLTICEEDLGAFRGVPGLIQKYYITEEESGAISGIYLFTSAHARAEFWNSELAASIPERYAVRPESLRVEQYEMAIVLNNYVLA